MQLQHNAFPRLYAEKHDKPLQTCVEQQRWDLVNDAEDDGVDEADARHADQTQQEEVGVPVQPEVCGLRVENGAHQLALLCTEACWAEGSR